MNSIDDDTLPRILRPSTREEKDARGSSQSELWVRIAAFLSLRSRNTQLTYSGIIKEWCFFLGAAPESAEAAKKILAATDLHASAYRRWLEEQPGQSPRLQQSAPTGKTSRELRASRMRLDERSRLDGLQHTLSNATIAKKFAALRRIYRMLIGSKLGVSENPFDVDRVSPPSAKSGQKRPTEMVDFTLVKEIIALPDVKTPKGLRDRGILSLLFGSGLRRSEVVGIRLGDIRQTPQGTCFVRLRATKAKRDSDQAIPSWAAKTLKDLIGQRLEEGALPGDYLFVGYRGRAGKVASKSPISDNGLYHLFKSYCMLAGASKFVTPHSARATAITKLLTDGIPHREVLEFSRHSSISMVELYDKRRLSVDQNPGNDLEYD